MGKPRVRPLPKTGDGNTYRIELDGRVRHARAHTIDAIRVGQVRADWHAIYSVAASLVREGFR